MTLCLTILTGCSELIGTDALFKDVARHPPKDVPAYVADAIKTHRPLAEWIVYQAEACEAHGCI